MILTAQSVDTNQIKKVFLSIIFFLLFQFSFSQSDAQKEMMYKHINSKSSDSYVSIFPKTKPIASKEVLFSEATVFPIYKIVLDKLNKPNLIQNNNYYLVLYKDKLYQFTDNDKSEYFKEEVLIKTILKLSSQKKDFRIVYFVESFGLDMKNLYPLIADSKLSKITEKDNDYSFQEFIDYKFGSIGKFKERIALDTLREKLKVDDYQKFIKNDYSLINFYCPNDSLKVLNTLIKQVKLATKNLSIGQETTLLKLIKQKINPFEKFKKSATETDLTFLKNKEEEYKKAQQIVEGIYEFKIYDVSITNELLKVLTFEQFNDYKNLIDLWKPEVETVMSLYNNKYRYAYGSEIVQRDVIENERPNYSIKKILRDCGCIYDDSMEARKKRIKSRE